LQGKILLLIVGDGIRENAEDLVEFFQRFTNIQFTLGLIELKIYQASKTQRLVIPDILFKTKEIQRAVISFEGMDPKKINVKVDNSLEIESQTKKKNKTLTPEEYFCRLKENAGNDAVVFAQKVLTDFSAKGYAMCWNTESFSIRAFDSETKMKQSIFAFTGDGQLWFWNNKYVTEDQNSELSNSIHAFYPELTFDDVWSFLRLANENNYNNFIGIIDKFARLTIEGMRNKK
jgi:hypothetical protein